MPELQYRVGIGHDTHRLEAGGPLRIGGIDIEFEKHAVGHSDADVLFHAITDALLGAAAVGDIGDMFPDDDPKNKNRNSAEMMTLACDRINQLGYKVVNLDCIVFLERPKLKGLKTEISANVAARLGIDSSMINVKAKTAEGLDAVGNESAIAAQCVALICRDAIPMLGF